MNRPQPCLLNMELEVIRHFITIILRGVGDFEFGVDVIYGGEGGCKAGKTFVRLVPGLVYYGGLGMD